MEVMSPPLEDLFAGSKLGRRSCSNPPCKNFMRCMLMIAPYRARVQYSAVTTASPFLHLSTTLGPGHPSTAVQGYPRASWPSKAVHACPRPWASVHSRHCRPRPSAAVHFRPRPPRLSVAVHSRHGRPRPSLPSMAAHGCYGRPRLSAGRLIV